MYEHKHHRIALDHFYAIYLQDLQEGKITPEELHERGQEAKSSMLELGLQPDNPLVHELETALSSMNTQTFPWKRGIYRQVLDEFFRLSREDIRTQKLDETGFCIQGLGLMLYFFEGGLLPCDTLVRELDSSLRPAPHIQEILSYPYP